MALDQERRNPVSDKRQRQLSKALEAASVGCILMVGSRIALTGTFRYSFLVWNLFLAWIPYILSLQIRRIASRGIATRKAKFLTAVIGAAWLCFYPNAPYILTDFIHVIENPRSPELFHSLLTSNAILWYDIILSSAFAFTGHIIGLISLAVLHRLLNTILKGSVGWAAVACAVLSGGYGIYLGRFERLNSWDVLKHPISTVRIGLTNLFNVKAVLFALCFGFFIFLTYLIVYALYETSPSAIDTSSPG
jgi:uncharacterized membrane protein